MAFLIAGIGLALAAGAIFKANQIAALGVFIASNALIIHGLGV